MTKVLIVEDDKNIREILEDFFKTTLHIETVFMAQDGLDAYTLACQAKFDIICTDHSMPFLTGLDLCNALRNKPNPNQHTPIIVASAFIPTIKDQLNTLDNIYLVNKPLDFERLARYVRMMTNQNEATKAL